MIDFADLDFTLADLHALGATRARNLSNAMMAAARRLQRHADALDHPAPGQRPRQCRRCFAIFTVSARERDLELAAGRRQRTHCRACLAVRRRERERAAQGEAR